MSCEERFWRRTDGTYRAAKVFHEDLGLLDLIGVDLGADHRAERDLLAELLGDGEGEGRLARRRAASEEEGAAREALGADEVENETASFASGGLANKAASITSREALLVQTEPSDVRVGRYSRISRARRSRSDGLHLVERCWNRGESRRVDRRLIGLRCWPSLCT